MDFYGYHNSWEEALYDWYVQENGMDLPLYVIDLLPSDGKTGNYPARRYDGNGWYIYEPISAWNHIKEDGERWTSQYGTGSVLSVTENAESTKDILNVYRNAGWTVSGEECLAYHESADGLCASVFLHEREGSGCYEVMLRYDKHSTQINDYAVMEPTVLRAMAESFTVTISAAMEPIVIPVI